MNISDKKIGVAVIGCGRISGHHCLSIKSNPNFELLAVCDIDFHKAEDYGVKYGVPSYSNYHKMLQESSAIDLVVIATPSGMHYEHAKDIILKYKKSLVVEKPTFLRTSHVEEIYNLASQFNIDVFAVFQNRHNRAVQKVINGIKSGELGKINSVSIRVRWCRQQSYYDQAEWRGTYSMDGGCLTNQGIHHIDLLRFLAGEIKRVICIKNTVGADIEVEDMAFGLVEYHNGQIGSIEITTAARPIDFEASISLVCANGLAQIGGIAVNELQIYTPDLSACNAFSEDFSGNVYGNGHNSIYLNIASYYAGDIGHPSPKEDVFSTIQLLNALYLSSERNEWVEVSTAVDSLRLGESSEELRSLYTT